ncbi:MAG: EAL domain-containing protein [Chloroflexi bacterium]|nr:EAL domain-containing protein [Chloroflexota bacterium]
MPLPSGVLSPVTAGAMDWNSSVLTPYRLRTVRVGVQLTMLTVVLMWVFHILPDHGVMQEGRVTVLLVGAALGAGLVWVLPWKRLLEGRAGIWFLYVWSAADIVLISTLIVATGGSRSEMFLLYALTSVFSAASYPPRGQGLLFVGTIASYLAALAVAGTGVTPAALFVRISVIALVTYLTMFLSRELMRQMLTAASQAAENASLAEGLRLREARFRSLVQNASDVVCVIGVDGYIEYISPAVRNTMGYEPGFITGRNVFNLIHVEDEAQARTAFEKVVATAGHSSQTEVRLLHANGSWRWFEATISNLLAEPSVAAIVVNYRDVTDRRAFEEQLRVLAFHDSLTALPNRAHFAQRTADAIGRAAKEGASAAVLLLDLDRFKTVNDSLGHEMGDELLVGVADRLRACLRPGDTLARLGGDEFTVLAVGVAGDDEALAISGTISRALEEPFVLGVQRVTQTASIGIALIQPGQTGSATDILRRADLAMYAAKGRGNGGCAVFDGMMSRRARERLQTEAELRLAIERGELFLEYQPLVSLRDKSLSGIEALVRWRHPERGVVSPAEFIPLAEETGLISPLGRWALHEACRQAREWQDQGTELAGVHVSVNVSVRQFQRDDVVEEVLAALAAHQLAPARLQLEITESVIMDDGFEAMKTLNQLREIGVSLAIDDFGTGYSSLSYLRQYPIDVLKLDKSFIDAIDREPEARELVLSMVGLAHALGLKTVAEGVETAGQLARLAALDCDVGQGYYLGRPMTGAALAERMRMPERLSA